MFVKRNRSTTVPASGPSTIAGKDWLVAAAFPETLQLLATASETPLSGPVNAEVTIWVMARAEPPNGWAIRVAETAITSDTEPIFVSFLLLSFHFEVSEFPIFIKPRHPNRERIFEV